MMRINIPTILFSVLLLSSFSIFVPIQESFGAGTTYPVEIGPNTFAFRDISNIEPCPVFNPLTDLTPEPESIHPVRSPLRLRSGRPARRQGRGRSLPSGAGLR